ncbi:putative feruloyl esterase B [Cyphellophora attinorum]|uniref:Carboxylic ester hydrolase n=1 Tax=Cyphellophora attinorum TaxID=1664694 RepID=A0A0N0NPF2_9EURO|nr:putative feruloyl esterase B [Phialophora attinorum]KPI42681.1 putative feruloyl esterase B [Phialophora attinorum]
MHSLSANASMLLAFSTLAYGQSTDTDFASACNGLASSLTFDNATISSTTFVEAGTNLTFPNNPATCTRPFQIVPADICRVVLKVATSSRSSVSIEGWLPSTSNWTGRVLSTGNGGISGCIQYEDLAYGSSLGFAAYGSNGGHDGMTGVEFLNNEDVVADFAWRALHTTANVAKQLTPQVYDGKDYTKSYYLGCSTGGRQGFKSAQSYPEDFDGIVAGAPALAFNNLTSWSGTFYQLFQRAGPEGFPPPAKWPAIDAALLAQCDALDGSTDGIIENTNLCNAIFRPEALICGPSPANASECISGLQAATIRDLFSPTYGLDGSLIFPPLPAAPGVAGTAYSFYAPEPFLYTVDWFKYAVYNNSNFNAAGLTLDDFSYAWNLDRRPDYQPFNSERYYNFVSRTMNLTSDELDSFYRWYRISGMGHCAGGEGAWSIGQGLGPEQSVDEANGNVLMAVVKWVEEGVAPDVIVGTKYKEADPASDANAKPPQVDYTRAHCRYPLRNVFEGGQWRCV